MPQVGESDVRVCRCEPASPREGGWDRHEPLRRLYTNRNRAPCVFVRMVSFDGETLVVSTIEGAPPRLRATGASSPDQIFPHVRSDSWLPLGPRQPNDSRGCKGAQCPPAERGKVCRGHGRRRARSSWIRSACGRRPAGDPGRPRGRTPRPGFAYNVGVMPERSRHGRNRRRRPKDEGGEEDRAPAALPRFSCTTTTTRRRSSWTGWS